MPPTIVMTSAPYCYGPTGKLLCLAESLADHFDLVYVGREPGLSLARTGPFGAVIPLESRDRWETGSRRALRRSEILISSLDYRALNVAYQEGVPSVFFDTLWWLREQAPPFVERSAAYIAE